MLLRQQMSTTFRPDNQSCEIDGDSLPVSALIYASRVDRLEDAISHFYNVINELRKRVSAREKKLKPSAKDDRTIN